jgi:hypothetical protein
MIDRYADYLPGNPRIHLILVRKCPHDRVNHLYTDFCVVS